MASPWRSKSEDTSCTGEIPAWPNCGDGPHDRAQIRAALRSGPPECSSPVSALMTVAEAAAFLTVSTKTVRRLIAHTGLAICASCGAGMTRTGTRRGERFYSYYSCAGCQQKGKSACRGRHVPMAKLDGLVIANVKDLFTPERLTRILASLFERQRAKNRAVEDRRASLTAELARINEKLKRLYRAIEDGIVDLDAHLKERIEALKTERSLAQDSLDRIAVQVSARAMITPDRLAAFSHLMREKLDTGDTPARKAFLRSVISQIEVDDDKIRIVGDKATLAAVIAGGQSGETQVRGFAQMARPEGFEPPPQLGVQVFMSASKRPRQQQHALSKTTCTISSKQSPIWHR
jgi:hypothetical protein